jgi:hypothetical protein
MHPRFDFTFSYWIFGWFIFYMLGIIPYNPKIWLLLGITINILTIAYSYNKYKIDWIIIFYEIIINIFIKIIPIWILYKIKTTLDDFLFGISLFIVYGLYVWFMSGSISNVQKYYNYIWNKKIHNEIYTPLLYYLL